MGEPIVDASNKEVKVHKFCAFDLEKSWPICF